MSSMTSRRITKLVDRPQGAECVVAKMKVEELELNRLTQMGIHIGSTVKLLQGSEDHGVLLAVGDARIGVNWDVASRIYVY